LPRDLLTQLWLKLKESKVFAPSHLFKNNKSTTGENDLGDDMATEDDDLLARIGQLAGMGKCLQLCSFVRCF
jgi:hypothetical protein